MDSGKTLEYLFLPEAHLLAPAMIIDLKSSKHSRYWILLYLDDVKKLIIFVKITAISYFATLLFMLLFWVLISGGVTSCTAGQEIEEGCKIAFPDTYIFLAIVNIPIAMVVSASSLGIFLLSKIFLRHK